MPYARSSPKPQAILYVTRMQGNTPVKGNCSVCDEFFDVAKDIGADRGRRLQARFEQHVMDAHSEDSSN